MNQTRIVNVKTFNVFARSLNQEIYVMKNDKTGEDKKSGIVAYKMYEDKHKIKAAFYGKSERDIRAKFPNAW